MILKHNGESSEEGNRVQSCQFIDAFDEDHLTFCSSMGTRLCYE
jgi:hypothetical protein